MTKTTDTDTNAVPDATVAATPEFELVAGPDSTELPKAGRQPKEYDKARAAAILAQVTSKGYDAKGASIATQSVSLFFKDESDAREFAAPLRYELAQVAPDDKRAALTIVHSVDPTSNDARYQIVLSLRPKGKRKAKETPATPDSETVETPVPETTLPTDTAE